MVDKEEIDALEELKATQESLGLSFEAELTALKAKYKTLENDFELQKSQLLDALLANNKLRESAEREFQRDAPESVPVVSEEEIEPSALPEDAKDETSQALEEAKEVSDFSTPKTRKSKIRESMFSLSKKLFGKSATGDVVPPPSSTSPSPPPPLSATSNLTLRMLTEHSPSFLYESFADYSGTGGRMLTDVFAGEPTERKGDSRTSGMLDSYSTGPSIQSLRTMEGSGNSVFDQDFFKGYTGRSSVPLGLRDLEPEPLRLPSKPRGRELLPATAEELEAERAAIGIGLVTSVFPDVPDVPKTPDAPEAPGIPPEMPHAPPSAHRVLLRVPDYP
jgi:hypothetical protein